MEGPELRKATFEFPALRLPGGEARAERRGREARRARPRRPQRLEEEQLAGPADGRRREADHLEDACPRMRKDGCEASENMLLIFRSICCG